MSDFATDVKSIPTALQSNDLVLNHIKYSFIIGFGIFVVLFPCYRSRKSFFDAIAARQIIRFARFFIICEFLAVLTLYYYYFKYGSPLTLHAGLSYGNGDSWLYGYGRPTSALIFVCLFGVICDMHPLFRWLTMAGSLVSVFADAISAYQVHDYYKQIQDQSAPSNGYDPDNLMSYYWRDIISVGLGTTIVFMVAYLTNVVGWCPPQLIHPALISGYDLDRYEVMHEQRDRRHAMEQRGFLGPIPVPRRERLTVAAMLSQMNSSRGRDTDDDERPLLDSLSAPMDSEANKGDMSFRDDGKNNDDDEENQQETNEEDHLL